LNLIYLFASLDSTSTDTMFSGEMECVHGDEAENRNFISILGKWTGLPRECTALSRRMGLVTMAM
jgi:hypothetical protein